MPCKCPGVEEAFQDHLSYIYFPGKRIVLYGAPLRVGNQLARRWRGLLCEIGNMGLTRVQLSSREIPWMQHVSWWPKYTHKLARLFLFSHVSLDPDLDTTYLPKIVLVWVVTCHSMAGAYHVAHDQEYFKRKINLLYSTHTRRKEIVGIHRGGTCKQEE